MDNTTYLLYTLYHLLLSSFSIALVTLLINVTILVFVISSIDIASSKSFIKVLYSETVESTKSVYLLLIFN